MAGLHLTLNVEQSKYQAATSIAGVRVLVHENFIMPFPEVSGLSISVGSEAALAIRKVPVHSARKQIKLVYKTANLRCLICQN